MLTIIKGLKETGKRPVIFCREIKEPHIDQKDVKKIDCIKRPLQNKKLKETIRILNEKLSKAHKQINRHIEDSYNDATQNDR